MGLLTEEEDIITEALQNQQMSENPTVLGEHHPPNTGSSGADGIVHSFRYFKTP